MNPRLKFALQTPATPLERGIEAPSFAYDLIGASIYVFHRTIIYKAAVKYKNMTNISMIDAFMMWAVLYPHLK